MMEPYVIHFAPLQGYTDSVYREAHAQIFGGVETYYTPFVRLEKTGFRNKELRDLVPEANTSASLVPQMIAASPEEFRRIAGLFPVQDPAIPYYESHPFRDGRTECNRYRLPQILVHALPCRPSRYIPAKERDE